jgi:hypothetical protein
VRVSALEIAEAATTEANRGSTHSQPPDWFVADATRTTSGAMSGHRSEGDVLGLDADSDHT